jgi:hypothetical protein
MKISENEIIENPEKYFKWMAYNLLITVDSQVFNLSFKKMNEQLIGGSYCFYCNGRYRTRKWINENCSYVLGRITE